MKLPGALAGAILACLTAAPAPAEAHRYAMLADDRVGGVLFWDADDVQTVGDEVQTSLLSVGSLFTPSSNSLTKVAVSCDWRSIRELSVRRFDDQERPLPFDRPESFGQAVFPSRFSTEDVLIDRLCEPTTPALVKTYASLAEALAFEVRKKHDGPPPPPPIVVPAPPALGFPRLHQAPPRLTLLTRSASGHMLFMDWVSVGRGGGEARAVTFRVLNPGVAEPQDYAAVMAIQLTRYDCRRDIFTIETEIQLDAKVVQRDANRDPQPQRNTASSKVAALELQAACSGRPGGLSFDSLESALAFAREAWTRKAH
jgi:hypothetical protein